MMDRNREARRAAAMTNGLQSQRRRHRTTSASLRESPEDDGQMELQETARLRERTAKKDRDREMRDRDRDRFNRYKRRRGVDKYMHGSIRDDVVSGTGDDSSEESINDENDDDDGPIRYVTPSNPVSLSSSSTASTLTHRRSYPSPSKDFRSMGMVPSWKAPEETIAFSIPRKARSSSAKRSHDCWSSGGGGGGVGSADQIQRQASSSPVRINNTAAAAAPAPSPPPAPVSPSSSTISLKKKIKPNGPKHKPPKACTKSSPSIQDEIEIEVAEVLYGLMRQSQAPSSSKMEAVSNDSVKLDKSTGDFQSGVHPQNSSSSTPPTLTIVAPKRKRPRPYPDENLAARTSPILPKVELDQAPKAETPPPSSENDIVRSAVENGDLAVPQELGGRDVVSARVEEASLSPKKESQDHNRVEFTSTSTKGNSALAEKENHREETFDIDLMAPPPRSRASPEREGVVEYGGGMMGDETSMVTDRETEAKANTSSKAIEDVDKKGVNNSSSSSKGAEFNVNAGEAEAEAEAEAKSIAAEGEPHKKQTPPPHHQHQHSKERNIDLQLDLEEPDGSADVNDHKLNIRLQNQPPPPQRPPPKAVKDEDNADNKPGQSSSMPLPMSVAAGWHGGLRPIGYVAPLQGVVAMDGTAMTSAPIHPPQFVFSPPRSKRRATHWCIASSISNHQKLMKVHPFWPGAAAAAGSVPLLGAKAYNLNMVPSPADLHAATRAGVVNSARDKSQPYAFFPASKDKSPQTPNAPDSSQKKHFLLPQSLPPGPPNNILHAPAFFFPFGQQQAAATASARPSTAKSPSTAGNVASTTTSSSAPMGTCSTAGPTMSFSYPNMGGSETQFMAFLGNGPYPFPIPAHVGVGAATPYRGSHPQAMSFFNGSYYSPQMLHPSQLQQQQQQPQPVAHSQIQQQNNQNPSISTASSSSQKHLQNQQQRPQRSGASTAGPSNPNLQNFQAAKGRPSQPPQHDMGGGGEDSPSTADSRTRSNLGVYSQSFPIPFHSPNFALMTQSSSIGGGSSNTAGVPNGDKKLQQLQQQSQQPAYPMSFASMNGATTPGLDISSMAHNHAFLQSLPEPARHNYQMAAAAQAAQAENQKKNNYQDGKTADPSNAEEERKAMASRASGASVGGQSIAFSGDLAENSISTVVDTSSCSLNLVRGSGRPTHSSGSNAATNSGASNSQQQQQMLFLKQQQYVAATVGAAHSKTPVTSNGNVYPDHLTSAFVMAAKFPNALPIFPPLVQSGGAPSQSPHWKNSVRPNTSQVSSPPIVATSTTSTIKNLPQQQGRPQQNHTQISFGAPATTNPKPSTTSQGQQPPNNNRALSPPMMVGSPSNSSVSKSGGGGGGNPRMGTSTSVGNKSGGAQASSLSSQQGKNSPSPSPSISSLKPSVLGSPHMMMSTSATGRKSQMQESQHQPPLSKQSIQQTQLFFSNPYVQASANTLTGGGYYLQRNRTENQHQQQVPKSQGSAPPTSSSGMLSLRNPVSLGNASTTSDPAKAAAAACSMKGGGPPQGMFHAAQYAAAQSAGGTHQLVPAGYSYVHALPTVQVKPTEQKQPAGE